MMAPTIEYKLNVRLVNQFVPNRKVSINSQKKLAKIINGTTFIASQYELSGIISLKDQQKTITDNNINDPKMTKYFVTIA
jgi:hypothetical protein